MKSSELTDRQIDELIAEHVMGFDNIVNECPDCKCTDIKPHWLNGTLTCAKCSRNLNYKNMSARLPPKYSTDIAAAWKVVEKIKWIKSGESTLDTFDISLSPKLADKDKIEYEACWGFNHAIADTAPKAICLAALKARGIIDE